VKEKHTYFSKNKKKKNQNNPPKTKTKLSRQSKMISRVQVSSFRIYLLAFLLQSETGELSGLAQHPLLF
jgi:hypothetical protein